MFNIHRIGRRKMTIGESNRFDARFASVARAIDRNTSESLEIKSEIKALTDSIKLLMDVAINNKRISEK